MTDARGPVAGYLAENSGSRDTTRGRAVVKTNLFELLGRPVEAVASNRGTLITDSPETYDDAGVLPTIADSGGMITKAVETHDDDSMLPAIENCGTLITRSNLETDEPPRVPRRWFAP